jgi:hypothetical protein
VRGSPATFFAKAGRFTGPNEFGLFLAKFQTECPYSGAGDKRRVTYFYRQVNGKPPADPFSPLDITDWLSKSNSLQRDCMQLGRGGGDPPLDNEYFDKIAATEVNGNTKKPPSTESQFTIQFEFGGRNGYWTGNHMILQTEYCIDCLTTILGNQYEYVFLFDHSSGHAKKRVGGLNVTLMTTGFDGELLRNTKIDRCGGYLGLFHDVNNPKMVQVGDELCRWYILLVPNATMVPST